MKNSPILILFSVFSLIGCNNSDVEIIEKHQNGKPHIIHFEFENNKENYRVKYLYDNGQLESEGQVLNSAMNGKWVWYFENGSIKDEGVLEYGFYIGKRFHWYENGVLRQIEELTKPCDWKLTCCDGRVINYYESGAFRIVSNYQME